MTKPTLSLYPVSLTAKSGDIVAVDLILSSHDNPIVSVDSFISYDASMLAVVNPASPDVNKSALFESVGAKVSEPGTLYVYAINSKGATAQSGKIATFYLQAQKTGITELKILCSQVDKSSQIIGNDKEFSNIIDCKKTSFHTATVNIGTGDNVLGASDRVMTPSVMVLIGVTLIGVAVFTMLVFKYKNLIKKIK